MSSPSEPPRHVDMQKWGSTWDRIRARQAEELAAPPVEPAPEARLLVTQDEAYGIGKDMWYHFTDDDCRLRATRPESFGQYLVDRLFNPAED